MESAAFSLRKIFCVAKQCWAGCVSEAWSHQGSVGGVKARDTVLRHVCKTTCIQCTIVTLLLRKKHHVSCLFPQCLLFFGVPFVTESDWELVTAATMRPRPVRGLTPNKYNHWTRPPCDGSVAASDYLSICSSFKSFCYSPFPLIEIYSPSSLWVL